MGLMDELRRLARPYEDEDEEGYEDEEEKTPKTTPIDQAKPTYNYNTRPTDADYSRPRRAETTGSSKVVSINATTTTNMKVVVVRPEKFDDDANEIADQLLKNHAVLLNLEDTDKNEARRLVDFISGAAFVLDGKVKKVAASTYIITPKNVDIIGDHTLLSELESNGVFRFK